MVVFHVNQTPKRPSGNQLFDDAARSMLMKLLDDGTALPQPPKEVETSYRGRPIQVDITGPNGDPSKCN